VNIVLNVVVDDKVFGLAELVDELRGSKSSDEINVPFVIIENFKFSPKLAYNLIEILVIMENNWLE